MDLIEEVIDIFLPALKAESKEFLVRVEYLKDTYKYKLEDLFKEQDKISPKKGD